jgi:hypothetical protein
LLEEHGYIAGRAPLYFCTENSGLPKLLRWSHTLRSDQFPLSPMGVLNPFCYFSNSGKERKKEIALLVA